MPDYANEIFLRDNNDIVYTHVGLPIYLVRVSWYSRNLIPFEMILINVQSFSARLLIVRCYGKIRRTHCGFFTIGNKLVGDLLVFHVHFSVAFISFQKQSHALKVSISGSLNLFFFN